MYSADMVWLPALFARPHSAERNRQSAAASRERKKHHIKELETRAARLSEEVARLQVAEHERVRARVVAEERLQRENEALKREVSFMTPLVYPMSLRVCRVHVAAGSIEQGHCVGDASVWLAHFIAEDRCVVVLFLTSQMRFSLCRLSLPFVRLPNCSCFRPPMTLQLEATRNQLASFSAFGHCQSCGSTVNWSGRTGAQTVAHPMGGPSGVGVSAPRGGIWGGPAGNRSASTAHDPQQPPRPSDGGGRG